MYGSANLVVFVQSLQANSDESIFCDLQFIDYLFRHYKYGASIYFVFEADYYIFFSE